MIKTGRKKALLAAAAVFILLGGFFVGSGVGRVFMNLELRNRYRESDMEWRQDLADGAGERQVRDRKNRELAENLQYISIDRTLIFKTGKAETEANISVDEQSDFSCVVAIVRNATGETLYKSKAIDPGHYIKTIRLDKTLKKGYYPCTAVWSYYTDGDEYVGETAWNMVVVINE